MGHPLHNHLSRERELSRDQCLLFERPSQSLLLAHPEIPRLICRLYICKIIIFLWRHSFPEMGGSKASAAIGFLRVNQTFVSSPSCDLKATKRRLTDTPLPVVRVFCSNSGYGRNCRSQGIYYLAGSRGYILTDSKI